VAIPLPDHGRCFLVHLHPIHHTRRHLRSLTSRLFIACLHPLLRPIIDNPKRGPRLGSHSTFSVLLTSSWLRFLLTLLEASVIHPLVFIVYYGSYRLDDNASISNSVVDCCLTFPFSSPPHPPVRIPSHLNILTVNLIPTLVSSVRPLTPFLVLFLSLPSSVNCIFHTRPHRPCISDYAPSHSHLIFTAVLSLLFSRVFGFALGTTPIPLSRSRHQESYVV